MQPFFIGNDDNGRHYYFHSLDAAQSFACDTGGYWPVKSGPGVYRVSKSFGPFPAVEIPREH